MYDPALGRTFQQDPLGEMFYNTSSYSWALNNPLSYVDPTGMFSTHTDSTGNVLAVYDDGDNGVYRHNDATSQADVDAKREQSKECDGECTNEVDTSGGGEYMGETEYWDEFISPETGNVMTNVQIQFGKSFDPIIGRLAAEADGMDLKQIAANSGPGGKFDIKAKYRNVGGLLNGKYATSRSAGNYLAGYNAEGGTYFGVGISFTTFQKLAGGLHVKGSLTNSEKAGIVLKGTSYGPPPAYGEVIYQYRMSKMGWNASKKK